MKGKIPRSNLVILLFSFSIFVLTLVFQYIFYKYYLIDVYSGSKISVVLGTFVVALFWILGFFLVFRRKVLLWFWTVLFFIWSLLWVVNVAVLYFTGFYLNPLVIEHLDKTGIQVAFNGFSYVLASIFVALFVLFIFVLRHISKTFMSLSKKYRKYYLCFAGCFLALSLVISYPFRSLPDFLIVKSFYQYFIGEGAYKGDLSPVIQAKLKNFGLSYDFENNLVAHKILAYEGEAGMQLPEKFKNQKPNVLIIFMESLSARLINEDVAPGITEMMQDPDTTVFKNYYNASSPTIYGLYSQLCSFLPPISMKDVAKISKKNRHGLKCLPEIMQEKGGYSDVTYFTAIDKTFAATDQIFANIGVSRIYDWPSLAKHITEPALGWGYSDHQLFKFVFDFLQKKTKLKLNEPWFVMMSSLDMHPPYSMPKDGIQYKDGKDRVSNTLHTMDDAFRQFWDKFKKSDLYDNTVVILTADHAIQSIPVGMMKFLKLKKGEISPYDEVPFAIYVPDNILDKEYDVYSSSLDFAPTVLNLFGIQDVENSFEGHSIFSDRGSYPYIMGMAGEYGFYTNIPDGEGGRGTSFSVPSYLECNQLSSLGTPDRALTPCETLSFFNWKKQMWNDGRYFEK